jgi:hypothetical protein
MIKRYTRTAVSQYIILCLIVSVIVGFTFLSQIIMKKVQFVDDFVINWAAGRAWLLEGQNPYKADLSTIARTNIAKSTYLAEIPEKNVFLMPLLNLLFYLPFSLIPYKISRAIWITLLLVCMGLITHLAFKLSNWKLPFLEKTGVILISIFWFPGVYAILTGQLAPVLILLLLAALFLIIRDQDTTAGFLLALTFGCLPATFMILLLLLIWSISHRRWSVIIAYFSGVIFLLLIWWMMLPSWPTDWLRNVFLYHSNREWLQTPIMTLATLLPGITNFISIGLHAILGLYMIILWITSFRSPERVFIWKAFMVLVLSFFFQIQVDQSFLILILPAVYLVSRFWTERWGVLGRVISWLLFLNIAIGSWTLALPDIKFEKNSLPILYIFGLPFIVVLGMFWIRWWALNIARYPYSDQKKP